MCCEIFKGFHALRLTSGPAHYNCFHGADFGDSSGSAVFVLFCGTFENGFEQFFGSFIALGECSHQFWLGFGCHILGCSLWFNCPFYASGFLALGNDFHGSCHQGLSLASLRSSASRLSCACRASCSRWRCARRAKKAASLSGFAVMQKDKPVFARRLPSLPLFVSRWFQAHLSMLHKKRF